MNEQPPPIRPYWQDGEPSAGYTQGVSTSKAGENRRLTTQQRVWMRVRDASWAGRTWQELAYIMPHNERTISGALSVLHKAGHLARLTGSRGGCKVYVLPDFVDGRATEEHQSHGPKVCPHCGMDLK